MLHVCIIVTYYITVKCSFRQQTSEYQAPHDVKRVCLGNVKCCFLRRIKEFPHSEECFLIPGCIWWSLIDNQRPNQNTVQKIRHILSNVLKSKYYGCMKLKPFIFYELSRTTDLILSPPSACLRYR